MQVQGLWDQGPRGPLARQPRLLSGCQAIERPCAKKQE